MTKEIQRFFSSFPEKTFRKGVVLINPDDTLEKVFYLIKGNVRQFVINDLGEEVTIHVFHPGSVLPVSLLLSAVASRYYFVAISGVVVKVADSAKVVAYFKRTKSSLLDLTTSFAKGLYGLSLRLEKQLGSSASDRVLSLLEYLSTKFGEDNSEGRIINLQLTHDDIASWTGLQRETVSRRLGELGKAGVIKYMNHKVLIKANFNTINLH